MSDVFKYQFSQKTFVDSDQKNRGAIQYVDIPFGVDDLQVHSVSGLAALINKLILYLASWPGDYGRTDRGGDISFIFNASHTEASRYRLMTTLMNIFKRHFPQLIVRDLTIEADIRGTQRGWKVMAEVRLAGTDEEARLEIPTADLSQTRISFIQL